ncbi:Conserved_hypothetical protein [Hexamita inflata]|uniref:Uncharacterized protein n=1 Tax=Hexamita inflata TaxID=28002 RepID=A0AA86QYF2_9EUKA|nr:Conserved hypothetical protein [Hexamita inflata]
MEFPQTVEQVPEFISQNLFTIMDLFNDYLAYAGLHENQLRMSHLVNLAFIKEQIILFFDLLLEQHQDVSKDVYRVLREELLQHIPDLAQKYEQIYKENDYFESGACYGPLPEFAPIILPPSTILPHHVIFAQDTDKIDHRSLRPGHLVAFWDSNAQDEPEQSFQPDDTAPEQDYQADDQTLTLLVFKSLKLGVISQLQFSNVVRPNQIMSILTSKSNTCLQPLELLDPKLYSRQIFEQMRPVLTLHAFPDKSLPAESPLLQQLYIDKSLETEKVSEQQLKNQIWSKLIYYNLNALELSPKPQTFLPIQSLSPYSTSFLSNTILSQTKQNIIAHKCTPLIDPFEDLICYQARLQQFVAVYNQRENTFFMGKVLMQPSKTNRFHYQIMPVFVLYDKLLELLKMRIKRKKTVLETLKETVVAVEQRVMVFAKFVIPIQIEQYVIEDCM